MNTTNLHHPVMLKESIHHLAVQGVGVYIDGTYGRGGHSAAILDCLDDKGQLIAIDKDITACQHAQQHFGDDYRFSIHHNSFANLGKIAQEKNIFGSVNGILLDLGISSPHLDDAERGFSFLREGPLDMRMDATQGTTAAQWLAKVSEAELADILYRYGEEHFSRRIARAIIQKRQENPIVNTTQLAAIVAAALPTKERHKHPATRSFQAIRIYINHELEELQATLEQTLDVLAIGGRLVVISFHSLEDRIVKKFINKYTRGESLPRGLPLIEEKICHRLDKVNGAVKASAEEIAANPRARSAILRIAEKVS